MNSITKILLFMCCFLQLQGNIVDEETRLQISLPDFEYSHEIPEESTKVFKHPEAASYLLFTIDRFDSSIHLNMEDYVNNFTSMWKVEDPTIKLISKENTYLDLNGLVPFSRRKWESSKRTVHQLFFIRHNIGYCLWIVVHPPQGISQYVIEYENTFWENFLKKIPKHIQFDKGL